jgi:hypothetical protein
MPEPKPNPNRLERHLGMIKNGKHQPSPRKKNQRMVLSTQHIENLSVKPKRNTLRTIPQPTPRAKRRNHTLNAQSHTKTHRSQKAHYKQLGPTKPSWVEKNMKQKVKVPKFKIIKCKKCNKNAMWGITTDKVEIQYCPNCGSAQMKWNQKLKGKL